MYPHDRRETSFPTDSAMSEQQGNIARRSAARLAAVQALYEIDMVGAPATPVLKEFLERRWSDASPLDQDDPEAIAAAEEAPKLPGPEQRFLKRLVNGVTGAPEELDKDIEPHLNSPWVVEQLDLLMRAILRAGAFEIRYCPDVPARSIITEYVGLAHAFFNENEPGLVHAVLDGLAKQFRSGEMADAGASRS